MGKIMNHKYSGIFFCDLDGTLADKFGNVSSADLNSLKRLSDLNILRVIATGRSPFSARKVIKKDFPIDYLICSTGCITQCWPSEEILEKFNLSPNETEFAAEVLRSYKMDFMVLHEVPENHKYDSFIYHRPHPDVIRRHKFYRGYYRVRDYNFKVFRPSCQLIGIVDNDEDLLKEITEKLKDLKIIRSTSPLDGKTMWIEVYPKNVSKGNAIRSLCSKLNVNIENTAGIGNDFNDAEMLETVKHPFVVANAPENLKKIYTTVADHKNSGVSQAVELFLKKLV
ncbi:MAG TPA: HAD-IIB family hydrolase [bacterium]|nr:HAD-IIB family hydrolase [bacterium]